jgi:ribosomal protein S18 acetylase RimI-like enzyme
MHEVNYIATDEKDIELITPLREKIRQYHVERSKYFKERITEKSIEELNKQMLAKSTHGIYLDLVKDADSGVLVGYCLSNINEEWLGEILSIYLEPEYRRQRIGYRLMERALAWIDRQGAKHKTLGIGMGNEEVVNFYRHFNFEIRTIIMEQVENKDK